MEREVAKLRAQQPHVAADSPYAVQTAKLLADSDRLRDRVALLRVEYERLTAIEAKDDCSYARVHSSSLTRRPGISQVFRSRLR